MIGPRPMVIHMGANRKKRWGLGIGVHTCKCLEWGPESTISISIGERKHRHGTKGLIQSHFNLASCLSSTLILLQYKPTLSSSPSLPFSYNNTITLFSILLSFRSQFFTPFSVPRVRFRTLLSLLCNSLLTLISHIIHPFLSINTPYSLLILFFATLTVHLGFLYNNKNNNLFILP